MKILISISDPRTYDNYALFRDCFVEQIAENKEYSILVLVGKAIKEQVAFTAENTLVERVEHNHRLTKYQRFIQFLYSYLLFTDTTYLVSSHGSRNDAPRTLLQDISFPFKYFYAHTFGKVPFVRNRIAPWLYELAFTERLYKKYFDEFQPDVVFLPNMCRWPADVEILAEAKRNKVATVGIPRNWDHMSKFFIPFKVDKICAWNNDTKKEAIQFQGYEPENIVVTGAPQVDFVVDSKNYWGRSEYLNKIGASEEDQVVLYASQGMYSFDSQDYVDMLLKAYDTGELPQNTYFVVRPYPGMQFDYDKLAKYANHPRVYLDAEPHDGALNSFNHLTNMMKHANTIVTTFSSVIADSALVDTPCIVANFDGYADPRPPHQSIRRYMIFTHVQDILPVGSPVLVESEKSLIEQVNRYLTNQDLDADKRKKLAESVFGFTDQKNTQRVIDVVRDVCAEVS